MAIQCKNIKEIQALNNEQEKICSWCKTKLTYSHVAGCKEYTPILYCSKCSRMFMTAKMREGLQKDTNFINVNMSGKFEANSMKKCIRCGKACMTGSRYCFQCRKDMNDAEA